MEILKNILIVIYLILCVVIIIITLIQKKESVGASGAIMGSSSNNFFEKNKGRTREGRLKKYTIILGIIFLILTVALGILYVI